MGRFEAAVLFRGGNRRGSRETATGDASTAGREWQRPTEDRSERIESSRLGL